MSNKMKVVIYLLRNDLRYIDNEALLWAHKNSDRILPLYCFDPRHFGGTYHFGFPKTGPHRLKFMLESLQDLREIFKKHGSGLILRKGKPELVVPELIELLGKENVTALTYHEEATQEELDVEKALSKCGVPVKTFWGATLVHKEDLPFSLKQLPNVYTQFRKAVESQSVMRKPIPMPDNINPLPEGIEEGVLPPGEELLGCKMPAADPRTAFPFKGGESTAQERLQNYLWNSDNVATYKETRNGMIGPEYSTKFSSWLAHGCISPRNIHWEIKKYERERTANQSTYWVTFELLWRDYFRFVALKFGNKLFFETGLLGKYVEWKQDKKLFNAWKEGKTGVPYVDANMREVAATGFMSNRGRQNVASFLTKDLRLDWRLGAEWFESMLIDHDVCSNYGNWLYSAGLGNDPREDRKFNMIKQGLDYDPDGEYIRLWVTELEKLKGGNAHYPWATGKGLLASAEVSLGETYPNPIVTAPEWSRHTNKKSAGARGGGGSRKQSGEPPRKNRGVDFYFKGSGPSQRR